MLELPVANRKFTVST